MFFARDFFPFSERGGERERGREGGREGERERERGEEGEREREGEREGGRERGGGEEVTVLYEKQYSPQQNSGRFKNILLTNLWALSMKKLHINFIYNYFFPEQIEHPENSNNTLHTFNT